MSGEIKGNHVEAKMKKLIVKEGLKKQSTKFFHALASIKRQNQI